MIKCKIVLVLGAGASMPFGFPSGYNLMMEIIDGTAPEPRNDKMLSLLNHMGFSSQIEDFRTALQKSGKLSVDAFLEHRMEFLQVGKAAIAYALMPRESEDVLFDLARRETWYQYFFNKLNTKFEDFEKNSVSVITFNYDRSLEHYLLTALKNAYGKSSEICEEKLRTMPLIHVYGQLGKHPYLGSDSVKYGAPTNIDNLKKCADSIQILHEDVTTSTQFKEAHDILRHSERICFIGFGYDKTNLQRLMDFEHETTPYIIGTAKGFTPNECEIINRNFHDLGVPSNNRLGLIRDITDSVDFFHGWCPFDDLPFYT